MIREITIHPVLNGFICSVGCQRVVFRTATELGCEVARYYTDPEKVEKDYIKNAVNRMLDQQPIAPPTPAECCGQQPVPVPTDERCAIRTENQTNALSPR